MSDFSVTLEHWCPERGIYAESTLQVEAHDFTDAAFIAMQGKDWGSVRVKSVQIVGSHQPPYHTSAPDSALRQALADYFDAADQQIKERDRAHRAMGRVRNMMNRPLGGGKD